MPSSDGTGSIASGDLSGDVGPKSPFNYNLSKLTVGSPGSLDPRLPGAEVEAMDAITPPQAEILLGLADRGMSGTIGAVDARRVVSALSATELESRLLELGFVEGARVEILHQGMVGRDPIAVRVDTITVAIRRREAMAISVIR